MPKIAMNRWLSFICLLCALTISYYDYLKTCLLTHEKTQIKLIVPVGDTSQEESPKPQKKPIRTILIQVTPGDTLARLLKQHGVSYKEIHKVIKTLKKVYVPEKLKPTQELDLTIKEQSGKIEVQKLRIRPFQTESEVILTRESAYNYAVFQQEVNLTKKVRWVEGYIDSSLYHAVSQKNIPDKIVRDLIMIYSYDVDFQRTIQPGDSYALMYTTYYDENSGRDHPGEILYAILTIDGKPSQVYRFKTKDGGLGYYNQEGLSVRKGLLRTPIDGARLSSGFGNRLHPVLGYRRDHKGVDFAAPSGTPIMAAGDGVIEKVGRFGGYGNYVRIRHTGGYSTAYAHLSRYAKGLRVGSHVRQGEIIGYVGSTGITSGSHLHFEVLQFNQHKNPLKVKTLSANKLTGAQLSAFKKARKALEQQSARLKNGEQVTI